MENETNKQTNNVFLMSVKCSDLLPKLIFKFLFSLSLQQIHVQNFHILISKAIVFNIK